MINGHKLLAAIYIVISEISANLLNYDLKLIVILPYRNASNKTPGAYSTKLLLGWELIREGT